MQKIEIEQGQNYTRTDLEKIIAQRANFTEGDIEIVLDTFEKTLIEICAKRATLSLTGLFTMDVNEIKPRKGFSIQDGRVLYNKGYRINIKFGKRFRDQVLDALGYEHGYVKLTDEEWEAYK